MLVLVALGHLDAKDHRCHKAVEVDPRVEAIDHQLIAT